MRSPEVMWSQGTSRSALLGRCQVSGRLSSWSDRPTGAPEHRSSDMTEAADPVGSAASSYVQRSAAGGAAGGALADALAGVAEDVLDDAAEGEDDDDDQGRDAGDEQAVLDGRGAPLVHLGKTGVEHDAQVIEHVRWFPSSGRGAGEHSTLWRSRRLLVRQMLKGGAI